MFDVFISYPRAERAKVEPVKDRLEALGLDVFFDLEGIDGGDTFPDTIDRALRASKAVLACWTPSYFTRKWCMIECRFGANADPSVLVPVALERLAPGDMHVEFQSTNFYDLTGWQGEDAHEDWNRTLKRLGGLVGRELAPALKKGLFGRVKVGKPPADPPPRVEQRMDLVSDLRSTWSDFPAQADIAAVEKFLSRVSNIAPGSGLEFEVEHHLDELRRAAEVEESARRARARRDWEDQIGPEAARAALAAKAGKPVGERLFSVRLDGVSGWPSPNMVAIPPGRFLMGEAEGEQKSRDDFLEHEVHIDYPIALGQHTVTFAEWDAALAAGARLENPSDEGWGRDRRPVVNVSWEDAQAYLAWLNERLGLAGQVSAFRLPSEAEWEYACRAGTTTPYSFGETISRSQAQFSEGKFGSAGQTVPVGSFPPNPFGLHDMHGNVD